MKKVLIFLLISSMSMTLWGEVTARCWITMTSDQGGTDKVKIYQDTETTDAFDNDADATKMWNIGNPSNVNIYCPMACGDLGTIRTNVIAGLPIAIQTNSLSENYTFTFSNVLGTVILEDMLLDSLQTMVNAETYNFTAAKSSTITDRFRIYKPFTPDAGDLAVCAYYSSIEIQNNPYTGDIVVKDLDGNVVLTKAPRTTPQTISLESLAAGHYVLVIGDKSYEFCNKPGNKQK